MKLKEHKKVIGINANPELYDEHESHENEEFWNRKHITCKFRKYEE